MYSRMLSFFMQVDKTVMEINKLLKRNKSVFVPVSLVKHFINKFLEVLYSIALCLSLNPQLIQQLAQFVLLDEPIFIAIESTEHRQHIFFILLGHCVIVNHSLRVH